MIYKFVYNKYIKPFLRRKMIIPVKCFTCGKVIGDKYRHYLTEVKKMRLVHEEGDSEFLSEARKK